MKFSFDDEDCFRIEKDTLVQDSVSIKACECVVLISERVALIEAKASAPNVKNVERLSTFFADIKKKFADSLELFSDMKSRKYGEEAYLRLPVNLRSSKLGYDQYHIVLIIHGHRLEWLTGLMDALKDELRSVVKQWNLKDSNIKVYNEELAKEYHLIVSYIPKADLDSVREPNGNADAAKVSQWFETR